MASEGLLVSKHLETFEDVSLRNRTREHMVLPHLGLTQDLPKSGKEDLKMLIWVLTVITEKQRNMKTTF